MFKKIISSILVIIILAMTMPLVQFQEWLSSYAATTLWQYNYTGRVQNFTAPAKGIYQIEAYGAQGGNVSGANGGKGSSTIGRILLSKNQALNIYVGGQNGYNGGGAGSTYQAVGGGATDIRLNGTAISNRILVAAGGGGAYTVPNYHQHVGNTTSGGACYQTPNYHRHTDACKGGSKAAFTWTGTTGLNAYFDVKEGIATGTTFNATQYDTINIKYSTHKEVIENNNDGDNKRSDAVGSVTIKLYSQDGTLLDTKQESVTIEGDFTGNIEFNLRNVEGNCYFTADLYARALGENMHKVVFDIGLHDVTSTVLNCGQNTIDPISYSLSCTKTQGVTIDSYTYHAGQITENSNGILGNGTSRRRRRILRRNNKLCRNKLYRHKQFYKYNITNRTKRRKWICKNHINISISRSKSKS